MLEIEERIRAREELEIPVGAIIFVILLLGVIAGVPGKASAAVLKCASHSLSRADASKALAAARTALPRSVRSFVSGGCWNPMNSYAWIETRRSETSDGVKQWWEILCRREDRVEWHCDPAEFKQLITLSVSVGDQSRVMELSFDRDVSLERARTLASHAVSVYADRKVSPLRECTSADAMDPRWGKMLPTGRQPIRVRVNRENGADSAYLSDADVSMSFPDAANNAGERMPCWNEWVVVD